jgi:hypothetical protein
MGRAGTVIHGRWLQAADCLEDRGLIEKVHRLPADRRVGCRWNAAGPMPADYDAGNSIAGQKVEQVAAGEA